MTRFYIPKLNIVCRAALLEMVKEVEKADPRKRIEVTSTKSIQYSKSETFLTQVMEDICKSFPILKTKSRIKNNKFCR